MPGELRLPSQSVRLRTNFGRQLGMRQIADETMPFDAPAKDRPRRPSQCKCDEAKNARYSGTPATTAKRLMRETEIRLAARCVYTTAYLMRH